MSDFESNNPQSDQPSGSPPTESDGPAGPLPWNWDDWWRCQRRGPVSGRYDGESTTPTGGSYALELRVDIDPRYDNSPVMNRISGDMYRVFQFNWLGRSFKWRTYQESWIVDQPVVEWSRCQVTITGAVRYWQGSHPQTTVKIVIPWRGFSAPGPATVTFTAIDAEAAEYKCTRKSHTFRDITLEIDVCASVNAEPILPSYDTHAHQVRPDDTPRRILDIGEAYLEVGLKININPDRTVIDDNNSQFDTWSPAELHDAMEQHFSRIQGRWPNWQMWCLMAGTFDNPRTGGIMFDARASVGGAGKAPERQGCAIFRNHSWFKDLVPNPVTQSQAAAMRKFLYTYVHEMGHAFNLLHSWDKSRPDALSWMNYDWRFDSRNGTNAFWESFEFRFDDEELIHLRHADRAAIIMGGDPWSSGGHLESPQGISTELVGDAPVELLVRSVGYFDFMQPVMLECRVRNLADLPIEVDTNLHPEFGGLILFVRRPDGRTLQYAPLLCQLTESKLTTLKPLTVDTKEGEDRHSENIYVSFGADGYYFDEPGEYLVKAVYQGSGNLLIPSNVHRVRIGRPFNREEDKIAQDYFNHDTGLAIYLNGSSSPFLQNGMDTLHQIIEQFPKSRLAAHSALTLAQNLQKPFFRPDEKNKLVRYRDAEPETVLDLTKEILDQQKRDDTTLTNLTYHQTRRLRAKAMAMTGETDEAKRELGRLKRYLRKHGVNPPVLAQIDAYADSL
jgi:hypothetical protein